MVLESIRIGNVKKTERFLSPKNCGEPYDQMRILAHEPSRKRKERKMKRES